MTEEVKQPSAFAEKYHADKILKRAKKKAKKNLQAKGLSKSEASKLVKGAVNNIANKPMKRSAGRGR
jgi:DNA-binding Xre family transcriptional regulator